MVEALGPADPTEISGYALRGKLGEGGMGSVYLSHTRGGQPVALKVIRREYARDAEFLRRFTREVEAARRVQGAYTAAVLDSSTEGPQPWLASAYVPGPSLAHAVHEHGPLPLRTVLLLAAGVAEALQSVHAAGVVHRDLKPSNVLLATDGPRVIDFGIARATDATALTGTDVRLGTPGYMSPEQVEGRPAGPPLDIFALGLVLHFAATATHPFGEGTGQALLYRIVAQQPDLTTCPHQLRPLIARTLTKDPDQRPTLDQIIDECHRIATTENTTLTRGQNWWLPTPIADEVTQHSAQSDALPAVPGPLSPAPAAPDPRRVYAPTAPDHSAAPPTAQPAQRPAPAATAAAGSRMKTAITGLRDADGRARLKKALFGEPFRRTKLSGWVAFALLMAGGMVLVIQDETRTPDVPTASDGWELTKTDVPLTIPAPPFDGTTDHTSNSLDVCYGGLDVPYKGSVFVSLNTLKADAEQEDRADADVNSDYTLHYSDCSDGTGASGAGPRSGFRLIEGRGSWGVVTKHAISADECKKAATQSKFPDRVTVQQIQERKVLRSGMGLCVLSRNQTLALLWITKDTIRPTDDNLRQFAVEATQWQPR